VLAWLLSFGREVFWVTLYYYAPAYMVLQGRSDNATALLITACTLPLFFSTVFGWAGRRFGVRMHLLVCFVITASATLAIPFVFDDVLAVMTLLVIASISGVGLDSVVTVPFLRAVRSRERPEMTMVYGLYRDLAALLPTALFSGLLSFFDLRSVFVATGLFLVYCAWMSRWVPRSM
jgi:MFS family permease